MRTLNPGTTAYARKNIVHILVVFVFLMYPFIYSLLVNSMVGPEAEMLLPRMDTMIAVMYFGLFAVSFDFISGYTGYLSFGHAAFYGIGGYFVIMAADGMLPVFGPETPFMFLMVLAGSLALMIALLIGVAAFRLTGVYFAMITLGFAEIIHIFFGGWSYIDTPESGVAVVEKTEGFKIGVPYVDQLNLSIGIATGDTVDGLFGIINLDSTGVSYYMIGLIVLICYFSMQRILHSPFGKVMVAIRENEDRAKAVGYNTFYYKLGAFGISAFFAGIAGALFAGFRRSVSPDNSLNFLVTGDALIATIIGGFGTLAGPLFGRLLDEAFTEFLSNEGRGGGLLPYLQNFTTPEMMDTTIVGGFTIGDFLGTFLSGQAPLYIGLIFVIFVLYVPNGLLGTIRSRFGSNTVAEWAEEKLKNR